MSILDLKVKIGGNTKDFDSAMKKMQKSFDRSVRKMQRTGQSLTRNLTVPIATLAAGAVTAAVDFEDAFAGVRKTVDATESEFTGLRKGILDMTKVMPTSAGEIAKVAEAAGQLGIRTDAILEFSKTMVQLGDTTNLTADQAATSLARIANVMQIPQDRFDEMGSTIVGLGNNFATTEAEIVDMAQRISSAGKIAGFAASDVFGLSTALSSVGVAAESGGTAAQKGILAINDAVARGGDKLRIFAETAGMSAEEFKDHWRDDAAGAFTAFINGLGRQGDSATITLEEVGLTSERTRAAFLSLANAGSLLNETIEMGSEEWEKNNALSEEAQKKYKTVASRLKMLYNRVYALGVSIGDSLMPAVDKAIEFVEGLTESFDNLSDNAKQKIMAIAAILGATGPIMVALGTLGAAISAISAPLVGVVAAFGTAAALIIKHWSKIENYFKNGGGFEVWKDLQIIAENTAKILDATWNIFGENIIKTTESSFGILLDIIEMSLDRISNFIDFWTKIFSLDIKGALGVVVEDFKSTFENIKKLGSSILDFAIDANPLVQAGRAGKNAFDYMTEGADNLSKTMNGPLNQGLDNAINGSWSMVDATWSMVQGVEASTEKVEKLANSVKGFTLSAKIPEDSILDPQGVLKAREAFDYTGATIEETMNHLNSITLNLGDKMDVVNTKLSETAKIGQFVGERLGEAFASAVVFSDKLGESLKNVGKQLASRAIMNFIGMAFGASGGLGSLFGGGLFSGIGKLIGVNDALIQRDGTVVKFHPDDNILAMKDFSKLIPKQNNYSALAMAGGGGSGSVIHNVINVDGRVLYESYQRYKDRIS